MKIAASMVNTKSIRNYKEINKLEIGFSLSGAQNSNSINDPFNFSTRFNSLKEDILTNKQETSKSNTVSVPDNQKSFPDSAGNTAKTFMQEMLPGQNVSVNTLSEQKRQSFPGMNVRRQVVITARTVHVEQEEVFVTSSGKVFTEDGRSIGFNFDLAMKRSTEIVTSLSQIRPVSFMMPSRLQKLISFLILTVMVLYRALPNQVPAVAFLPWM